MRYHWPGNVRELRNVVERAMILRKNNRLNFDFGSCPCDKRLVSLLPAHRRGSLRECDNRSSHRIFRKPRGNMKRYRFGLLNLIVGLCLFAGTSHAAYRVGDTVANWTLNDHLGRAVSLTDFAGSVVIINFWQDT